MIGNTPMSQKSLIEDIRSALEGVNAGHELNCGYRCKAMGYTKCICMDQALVVANKLVLKYIISPQPIVAVGKPENDEFFGEFPIEIGPLEVHPYAIPGTNGEFGYDVIEDRGDKLVVAARTPDGQNSAVVVYK